MIVTPNFSGPTGEITVSWNSVTDTGSGVDYYELGIKKDDGTWSYINKGDSLSHTYTELEDNAVYSFCVRVYDQLGNCSGDKINSCTIGDYSPPTAPTTLSITPADYTNDTTPTITWSGITDANLVKAQYSINNGTWTDIPASSGTASGLYSIDCTALADGEHIISLRGADESGLAGEALSVTYKKDTTAPTAAVSIPDTRIIGGSVRVTATIDNATGETSRSSFDKWTLKYGLGTAPTEENLITIATGTNTVTDTIIHSWNLSALSANTVYSLYLVAEDSAGNIVTSNRAEILVVIRVGQVIGHTEAQNLLIKG